MLLRRMISHVKQQNWFAVLLDFVIVVLGIYIGMQLTEWNDARINKRFEQQLVLQLNDEMTTLNTSLNSYIENAERSLKAGSECLRKVYERTLSEAEIGSFRKDCFLKYMYGEAQISRFLRTSVIFQLEQTDNFSRIEDPALRDALFSYIREVEGSEVQKAFIHSLYIPSLTFFQTNIRQKPGEYPMSFDYQMGSMDVLGREDVYNHMQNVLDLRAFGIVELMGVAKVQADLLAALEDYRHRHELVASAVE